MNEFTKRKYQNKISQLTATIAEYKESISSLEKTVSEQATKIEKKEGGPPCMICGKVLKDSKPMCWTCLSSKIGSEEETK